MGYKLNLGIIVAPIFQCQKYNPARVKKKKRFYKRVLGSDIRKVGEKNDDKDDKEELGERRE